MKFDMLAERINRSELFDADWYSRRYHDVKFLGMDPAEHYIRIGARLARDPGPDFSTAFYLLTHTDVADAGINPLWHFLAHGQDEGRRIAPSDYHLQSSAPEQPVPLLEAPPPSEKPARLIAYYLPQFHPIPENDQWWGDGFTEWTNVRPATPQFNRHYQPHVPGELGYYDLRDTSVQKRQIELAKLYGIEGFCFYFYWFAGTRLLETPLQNYLADSSLDLPFCLSWANENWSRRWDGRDQDILMAQMHSPEDDLAFIAHVAQYMRDSRYIRIEGKPLLLVYRPNLLPDPPATVGRWRQWCRDNGLGEIYLAYTQSFESNDPREYGFDAAIEFPPNNSGVPLITKHVRANPHFEGKVFDWSALVERSFAYPSKPYTLFRGLCPSWDNTARRGAKGTILANSSPERFTRWATNAIRDTKARFESPDERLVFVNAWNEWAEGAHLEPDQRYGYAWLESVRVALACNSDPSAITADAVRIAIVVDATASADLPDMLDLGRALPGRHKLFVVTTAKHGEALAKRLEMTGREFDLSIADDLMSRAWVPVLAVLPKVRSEGFGLVISLRARPGTEAGETQSVTHGSELLDPNFLEGALPIFDADSTLGMICPESERIVSANASDTILNIGGRLGLSADEVRDHAVWRGQAFLARTEALIALESLSFSTSACEPGSVDYSPDLAAAIERGLALSAIAAGLRVSGMDNPAVVGKRRRVVIVSHDGHPHGAQLLALNMARSYKELGFDVDMIVLGPGSLLERFREVATVHMIDLAKDAPSSVARLLRAMRATCVDFAIANTTVSGLMVPLLKKAGIRTVSLIHELPGILQSYGLEAHARAIADHADSVVFPAQIVKRGFEAFIGATVKQAQIRPQGLYLRNPHCEPSARESVRKQMREHHGLAPDARLILCVGYADHRKGLDLFAETCVKVMSSDPRAVGIWAGHADRTLLAEVQESIKAAGMHDRFVFTGLVDNPQDYYTASDVYALTSREDPFPSVVMEALDARIPVVSFAGVVGSEELLERGSGLLVPAFDTEQMAAAIRELLGDPALAGMLAERGKEIIDSEFRFRHYLFDLASLAGRPIPKVSVIVPNYNYARYLRERLESIDRQTAPIFELIVLDDASNDDSVDIIKDFLDDCGIPSLLDASDRNSGSVFKQWQRGMELAQGDFVWIAEADDLADREFLEKTLPAFSDPDVILSYAQSRQMSGDGEILCEHYLDYVSDIDRERWTRPYVVDGAEEISCALFVKNTIPNVSAVVFRRNALLRTLRAHHSEILTYRNAGDWIVYLRMLETGKIAFSPLSLNSHRRHQSSVTVSSFDINQLQEIVQVQATAIERHQLGRSAVDRADRYAQSLYDQFGLAASGYISFREHPQLRAVNDQAHRDQTPIE